jgi:hypothetical protein
MTIGTRGIVAALMVGVPVAVAAAVGISYREELVALVGSEAAVIADSHGLVERHGPVLTFYVKSGAAVALTDRLRCGDLACPVHSATQYRYRGWDDRAAGYRLLVGVDHPNEMTLAWELAGDDPVLVDTNDLFLGADRHVAMPSRPPPAKTDPGLLDWLAGTARDQDKVEGPRLAASGGHAFRKGADLTLAAADGRKLVLTDDLLCGQLICPPEIYIGYEYRGADATGRFHAVAEHFYETGDAFLFDSKSGIITPVAGPVTFSPDGARAVSTLNDPQPHGQHDIEIWSLKGDTPALEYCYVGDSDNTYETVRWDDPDRITFTRGKWQSDAREPVALVHDAAGWHSPAANCM